MKFAIENAKFEISGNKIIIDCGDIDPKIMFNAQIEVGSLNPGDNFRQNGEKFIVLDKNPNGDVLIIKSEFMDDDYKFGKNSDWRESPIRHSMNRGEILRHMCELFGEENIMTTNRNLTSLDGLDDYGTCIDMVTMLTAAEYAKYHKILGLKSNYDRAWWTITPVSTPSNDYSGSVCCVLSSGILGWRDYCWGYGVRPVLTLASSTLVSVDKE